MPERYDFPETVVIVAAGGLGIVGLLSARSGLSAWALGVCVVLAVLAVGVAVDVRRKVRLDHEAMRWHLGESVRESTAAMQLVKALDPRAPLPPMGDWAMPPSALLALLHHVRRERPDLVVELGSGTSTVLLGHAAAAHGGRVVSFEHSAEFAEATRQQLADHGLDATCEVVVAPLVEQEVDGASVRWYDRAAVDSALGDASIGLLVVDGPPELTGPLARHPALPVLADRLAPGALVVLDDVDRNGEQEILRRWDAAHDLVTVRSGAPRIAIRRLPGEH